VSDVLLADVRGTEDTRQRRISGDFLRKIGSVG
jgi:hypothetical protein